MIPDILAQLREATRRADGLQSRLANLLADPTVGLSREEDFWELWQAYAECPDDQLDGKALELKRMLRSITGIDEATRRAEVFQSERDAAMIAAGGLAWSRSTSECQEEYVAITCPETEEQTSLDNMRNLCYALTEHALKEDADAGR